MQVGDIRYVVFEDPESGEPWVYRCKVIKMSPKGQSITFDAIGREERYIFKNHPGERGTAKTKVEAIKNYQEFVVNRYFYREFARFISSGRNNIAGYKIIMPKDVIEQIIKSQKLIDEIMINMKEKQESAQSA